MTALLCEECVGRIFVHALVVFVFTLKNRPVLSTQYLSVLVKHWTWSIPVVTGLRQFFFAHVAISSLFSLDFLSRAGRSRCRSIAHADSLSRAAPRTLALNAKVLLLILLLLLVLPVLSPAACIFLFDSA